MYSAYFFFMCVLLYQLVWWDFFQNVTHSVITVPNFAVYINITNTYYVIFIPERFRKYLRITVFSYQISCSLT